MEAQEQSENDEDRGAFGVPCGMFGGNTSSGRTRRWDSLKRLYSFVH